MNWEAVGAVGEVAGAIAVVLTLLYFAAQIRTMKNNSFNEILRAISVDEIELEKMRLQYADLLVRGNSGQELSDTEQYEVKRIYNAHETFSFHGHIREQNMGEDRNIRCVGFAILLEDNPVLLAEFGKRTFPGKEVYEWKDIVENLLKERSGGA